MRSGNTECSVPPKRLDTLDDQRAAADPFDPGPQPDQEIGQVGDFGFARRVFKDRLAVGEHGSHQEVLGARHRHGVKYDMGAPEPVGAGLDKAFLDHDIGAHCLQTRNVQVDGTGAYRAAARQRDVCLTESRDQRTEHENGRTHRLDEFVRCLTPIDVTRVNLHREAVVNGHLNAQHLQQRQHRGHVLEVRHIADRHGLARQQGTGQDRQRGVLGARYRDLPGKARAALDR